MTKEEARAYFRQKRAHMEPAVKARYDQAIVRHLLASSYYQNCEKLLGYYPLPGEIDVLPLLERARRDGKIVGLPVCSEAGMVKKLTFMRYSGKVKTGRYGICVPEGTEIVRPDAGTLCLVPGFAYRQDGHRLGYGGGYYDRFLCQFSGVSVGLFYRSFLCDDVPADPFDIPCGIIVTEDGIH
ncbi:MAG: 5-formyltetrahydrofolate cyclo-ligase [Clostridiales bacterium]|nr:5-formyltetrahydrofolate cyclo-ligase [Clostridiales bacterium]